MGPQPLCKGTRRVFRGRKASSTVVQVTVDWDCMGNIFDVESGQDPAFGLVNCDQQLLYASSWCTLRDRWLAQEDQ